MNSKNIFEYNVEDYDLNCGVDSLEERRAYCAKLPCATKDFQSEVTIWIQAYNNFDKTKRCIESVLKYTTDVDYDLILVNNNAGDETYEYFKAVDYPKKTILNFSKNTGSAYPFTVVPIEMISSYFVLLNNDIIVTKKWLSNLLKIMKSDAKIGVVNPSSNNVSNNQDINFEYSTYEEMQTIAEKLNVSDNSKWKERLRVVTLGTLVRKECLYAMGWPFFDVGFSHNFMDDDMSFRARRTGYKLIVTGDTWVCHDHPFERENKDELLQTIKRDMGKFKKKYYGINPWRDATNSIVSIKELIEQIVVINKEDINILGIDPKCGMPILDIKNLFPYGKKINTSAYFQEAKYYIDLMTICNGQVICDREENLKYNLSGNIYDYIIIGESINMYDNPIRMIKEAYDLLSDGGQMIFSLKNTNNVISVLKAIGYGVNVNGGICQNFELDKLNVILHQMGIKIKNVTVQYFDKISEEIEELMEKVLNQYGNKDADKNEVSVRLKADKFWIIIQKE